MDAERLKNISRKGALARIKKYGNPGTPAGRKLGGLNSILVQRKRETGFKVLLRIRRPRNSIKLAELMGIFIGDGHVDEYQATVTTNSETDYEHAKFTGELITSLFGVRSTIKKRLNKNACMVVVYSKELSKFLVEKGMVKGNKIRLIKKIPKWIEEKKSYKLAFIKGLFDTDGSVYIDNHNYRGKIYRNIALNFTNRSLPVLIFFKKVLEENGFHPTQKTEFAVFLRREKEIKRYFDLIGSSNPKHRDKMLAFFRDK